MCDDAGLVAASLPGVVPGRFRPHTERIANGASVYLGVDSDSLIVQVHKELKAYFAGTLREFTIPLAPRGTPFQREVWDALCRIPYGETRTYTAIASEIDRPQAVRAVGHANGSNPIPIIIPCHRLVGSDGSLTGYAGGLGMKRQLIDFERGAVGW